MKLVFVTEARFIKDINGNIYGDSSFNFELWQRYLMSFSEIVVMARVKRNVDYIGNMDFLSSGKKVSFIELPYFVGPLQYVIKRNEVQQKIKESIENINAVFICRIPGAIGNLAIKCFSKKKIPFGVEVVGDPWDVFSRGSIKHVLRLFFKWQGYFNLKRNIAKASAILYVTESTLQERYPVKPSVFQIAASNVKIKDELTQKKPKSHRVKKQYTILSVGSLEQMYKAPDVVLRAIKTLVIQGVSCKLFWLGDGVHRSQMEALAIDLEITEHVNFVGNVSNETVKEYLLLADIFVLVSRTEGLPRAIIEAMSYGLPCIGTLVGGIPELIEKEVLIPKNNPKSLAEKIKKLISEPNFYNQQSLRNLLEAEKYRESILNEKRKYFYEYLIDLNSKYYNN